MLSFEEALEQAIEQTIFKTVNTSLPAVVTDINDAEKGLIEVQPLLMKAQNDEFVKYEKIKNVPLTSCNFGNFSITIPEKEIVGTTVLLIVCQRSLDTWMGSGDIVKPVFDNKYDISDCIAIGGLINKTKGSKKPVIGDTLKINMGDSFIDFEDNGTVNINGHLTVDL